MPPPDQALIDTLRASLTPDLRAEFDGLSQALDIATANRPGDGALSLEEFWRAQFLGETNSLAGGAALALAAQADGRAGATLAYALQGELAEALAPLWSVTVLEKPGGDGVALIELAVMLAAPAGFNGEGLALALIDGPAGHAPPASPNRSAFHTLRLALEREAHFEAASRRFALSDYGRGLNVLIADSAGVRVLERARPGAAALRSDEDPTRQEMT